MSAAATPRKRGRAGARDRARRMARTSGLCELCQAGGRVERATVVDHIVPLAHGGADEDGNTRNLCDGHHRAATAQQFAHARRAHLSACGADGHPTDPDHPWNRGAKG